VVLLKNMEKNQGTRDCEGVNGAGLVKKKRQGKGGKPLVGGKHRYAERGL